MQTDFRKAAVAAIIVALSVAGCSGDKEDICPTMSGVTDASVQTVFRPGAAQDPANVLYTAEIMGVTGACDFDKKSRETDACLRIDFRATRAPSSAEAHYVVPYFVAVTEGARILARRNYSVTLSFQSGQTVATTTDTVGSTQLITAKDKQPYDYQILVGLQLSRADLDYNRRSAHYQP